MNKLLIKNGTIVTSKKTFEADILVENGKIKQVEKDINVLNIKTFEAKNKLIFAGGVDPHVHLQLSTPAGNSSDNFESGSKAAIAGGTTTILDFITPNHNQSLIEATHQRKEEAKISYADYSFHLSPIAWSENLSYEIEEAINQEGITSFKAYMAYKKAIGISDDIVLETMKYVKERDGMVTLHCENGDLIDFLRDKLVSEGKKSPHFHHISRPSVTEYEAVNRAIIMSEITNCPLYIVHVSTKESVNLIEKAQKKGLKIYAETCPHYLILDESKYQTEGFEAATYVMSPPLRAKEDQERLWKAIKDGVIQTIGTDHCPFNMVGQKDLGKEDFRKIPNGVGGIEHRLSLLYTYGVLKNRISINRFVEIISEAPAQIFGFDDKKGKIEIGLDADLVIWDKEKENTISAKTHFQNCDRNIYEGIKTKGGVSSVIKSGKIIFQNNEFFLENVKGKFISR